MNIALLERELATKKTALAAVVEATGRACAEHVVRPATATEPAVLGRGMTAEERATLEAAAAECRSLTQRIERAQADERLLADLTQLTGGASGAGSPQRTSTNLLPFPAQRPAKASKTIGWLFVSDGEVRGFVAAGGHRRAGTWSSPAIEAERWASPYQATTITEDPASGGALLIPQYQPGIVALPMRRPVVADLCAPGTSTSNSIVYMQEQTFTNAAAPVKEANAKPESALVFTSATAPVRKIAHWIPVSEEMLEDVPAIAAIIDARLTWGVEIKEEDQLMNGTGVDPNLLGFNNLTGLQPPVTIPATPPATAAADALLKQITAISVNSLIIPDGFVMNPTDWMNIQLIKNQQGNYLGAGPWAAPQVPMIWGISGVVTPAQPQGVAMVGGFGTASQIFRKGGVRVEATNSHQDFFIKNLVAIRAEERLALAVYKPSAFGKVTGLLPLLAGETAAAPPPAEGSHGGSHHHT